jgi:hypothetical protein
MLECWEADPDSRPMIDEVMGRLCQIYPGPLVMMRWMIWMRRWQQKQAPVMHSLGFFGTSSHRLWLTEAEVNVLEEFVNVH